MARTTPPITLSSQAPEISFDELTTCLAEASAILWAVKLRREERLRRETGQEEQRTPRPKDEEL
jgi:hypothetical protein